MRSKYPNAANLGMDANGCSGAPTWYTKDPSCQYAVNEYLWLNELHPTFPMHNATAASVAKFLGTQKCT
jgi:phospholipase/lecithinase/hemolysin